MSNALNNSYMLSSTLDTSCPQTSYWRLDRSGYLVGDSPTWADLYLAEFAELANKVPSLYDGFPEVIIYLFLIRHINR